MPIPARVMRFIRCSQSKLGSQKKGIVTSLTTTSPA